MKPVRKEPREEVLVIRRPPDCIEIKIGKRDGILVSFEEARYVLEFLHIELEKKE